MYWWVLAKFSSDEKHKYQYDLVSTMKLQIRSQEDSLSNLRIHQIRFIYAFNKLFFLFEEIFMLLPHLFSYLQQYHSLCVTIKFLIFEKIDNNWKIKREVC